MKLCWKCVAFGAAVVVAAVLVYEALAGILGTTDSMFNPDSYR